MDADIEAARSLLRREQAQAYAVPPESSARSITSQAVERFLELTRTVPAEATGRVRRGPFTYDAELERQRIAAGIELIRRVHPGPQEDANYFAMLALQAASIELSSRDVAPDLFSTYLLGTAHSPDVNAFSQRTDAGGHVVVVLNSGLVDFVYQAAKVVVEATAPRRSGEGERGLVTSLSDLAEIRERIAVDRGPAERLYRTLEAYFFHGYPRATTYGIEPPDVQHPPLSLLVGMAERFMIAHEYGHGLVPALGEAPSGVNVRRAEEYFADGQAVLWTVLSAAKFEGVQPEFPLSGAIFVLACLDIRRRALSLLSTGDQRWMAAETETHPAPRSRASEVISAFRRSFDVQYGDEGFDLWFRPRPDSDGDRGLTPDRASRCYLYAQVLEAVWSQVEVRLLADQQSGRPLHRIWE